MSEKTAKEHGGARANAGRKAKFQEPTKVIRVPESQVSFIKNWILENAKTGNLIDFNSSVKARAVQPNPDKIYQIPLAIERVAAGFPSPAQDHIEQALDLNSLSMLGAGIDIDDPLLVDRSIAAKAGDIVIAMIDNEFTVKRMMIDYHFSPPKVWLKAENPDYQNIYIEEGQELVIWGVVTYNLKPMR